MATAGSPANAPPGLRSDWGGLIAAYAGAHFGKSLFWYASESLFAFFLTEIAHLASRTAGWVLAASFLLSGALDVGIGSALGDRLATASAAGRLQLFGMVGTAVCTVLLFAVPSLDAARRHRFRPSLAGAAAGLAQRPFPRISARRLLYARERP
jgi:hypothetical protein